MMVDMGETGQVRVSSAVAALSVDERRCAAVPLPGGVLGCASGLVAVVCSPRAAAEALSWPPGRVLVVCGLELARQVVTTELTPEALQEFAGLVVLADPGEDVSQPEAIEVPIPTVLVTRATDCDRVRRGLRVQLDVHEQVQVVVEPGSSPSRRPRRLALVSSSSCVPGVIDVRTPRG